ncbi:MAG: high-affinity nickel-transport family protein [Candidatus Rokubacteria bacterium]|nr:high-affinity nickel-transport family protein [Candidatus Rokubacteria bacterium]
MTGDPVFSAALLGFVLGLQHATDPDHLVAVATIVTRERRFRDGALVGVLWGIGHAATLGLAGGLVIALGGGVGAEIGTSFELLVALMIVALGGLRLRDALRGFGGAPPEHLLADHEHAGRAAFHSHPHAHGGHVHAHPHVHPSRRLLAALGDGRGRALLIGAVHGLAGTAAVSLLVLATLRSPASGLVYLTVFGLGTIAGMTALTAVMAYPVSVALRFRRAQRALAFTAGVGAITFGFWYASRLI